MTRKLRESWMILALLGFLGIAGVFILRAYSSGRHAQGNAEQIRPWMSVPYVAHSRHVPSAVLWSALGIPPHRHDRRPIGRIAREQKRPVDDVIATLKQAIDRAPKAPH